METYQSNKQCDAGEKQKRKKNVKNTKKKKKS